MSGSASGVLVKCQNGVATVTLNHPERANALDPAEFHDLARVFETLSAEPALSAVVLTGQGDRAFCAGLNLRNGEAIKDDLASAGPTGLSAALRAAANLGIPVLGRVNGACVAGGMGLLGACDYVIAVNHARFGLPEIKHGFYPHVALAGLSRRGAPTVLRRLADSGALIDAAAALDAGLVDEVVSSANLDEVIQGHLDAILRGEMPGSFATRIAKRSDHAAHMLDRADEAARTAIVNS